ncbi:MAG TPA: thiamine-phosphate kinase [Verrucomicrobiae bacterium]|jgi:thiamine-monophosphate kinase|nr:thiamine-phosphate kinase [Verrucomicrobiae bacterium]
MSLTEKRLIDRIRQASSRARFRGTGIGDDCAALALPGGHEALVTTDFSLEGVHFRREWHPPDSVGHRCLARGLSDIAAMGGNPRAAFLSLAVPPNLHQRWIDGFVLGLLRLADRHGVQLAGGDTAQSPDGILADIVVLGSVPAQKAVLRSGAKAGDLIYVTGTLGSSVATLNELREGKKVGPKSRPKHFYPEPRIGVGRYLREKKLVSAMIDVSDGLSTDLDHICEESGVGAVVYSQSLPITRGTDAIQRALHGGEEYELLFTAPAQRRIPKKIAEVPVSLIGEIIQEKTMKLATPDGKTVRLKPGGWQHFA